MRSIKLQEHDCQSIISEIITRSVEVCEVETFFHYKISNLFSSSIFFLNTLFSSDKINVSSFYYIVTIFKIQ